MLCFVSVHLVQVWAISVFPRWTKLEKLNPLTVNWPRDLFGWRRKRFPPHHQQWKCWLVPRLCTSPLSNLLAASAIPQAWLNFRPETSSFAARNVSYIKYYVHIYIYIYCFLPSTSFSWDWLKTFKNKETPKSISWAQVISSPGPNCLRQHTQPWRLG